MPSGFNPNLTLHIPSSTSCYLEKEAGGPSNAFSLAVANTSSHQLQGYRQVLQSSSGSFLISHLNSVHCLGVHRVEGVRSLHLPLNPTASRPLAHLCGKPWFPLALFAALALPTIPSVPVPASQLSSVAFFKFCFLAFKVCPTKLKKETGAEL